MGCLYAHHLAEAGETVWIYDVDVSHVRAIAESGLEVTRNGASRFVRMRATTDPRQSGPADIAMVFVKYRHTRTAVTEAAPMIGPDTVIATLQNGIGNVEIIRSVHANPLVYGLTTLTSELHGPGRIEASYAGAGETHLWRAPGTGEAELARVHGLLAGAGIASFVSPDIDLRIWKKLVVNCCLNSLCAITGLKVGDLVDQPGMWDRLADLTREICAAARASGVTLSFEEGFAYLHEVAEDARAHLPSMLIDVMARRPTEIGCLNEAVVERAARAGLPVPLNATLAAIVRGIERSWSPAAR